MTLLIVLVSLAAYLFGAVSVYRRLAYAWNARMLGSHEFQSSCDKCHCSKCGHPASIHYRYAALNIPHNRPCAGAHWEGGMHTAPMLVGLLASLVGWVPISICYAGVLLNAKYGKPGSFFVPPPTVESKDARQKRLLAERDQRIAERDARIIELERKVGIK